MSEEYKKYLEQLGYVSPREIPGRGICALYKFLYTTAIVSFLDDEGFYGRWCYPNIPMAVVAFNQWDGVDDPPLGWIKYKGKDGERSNPFAQSPQTN